MALPLIVSTFPNLMLLVVWNLSTFVWFMYEPEFHYSFSRSLKM